MYFIHEITLLLIFIYCLLLYSIFSISFSQEEPIHDFVHLLRIRSLMIVPGILVCSSFLISVCMFIVSKAVLISSATVIVRAGGAIWLNPFATVLFNVCSSVTVECFVLYPSCVGVVGMFAVM